MHDWSIVEFAFGRMCVCDKCGAQARTSIEFDVLDGRGCS